MSTMADASTNVFIGVFDEASGFQRTFMHLFLCYPEHPNPTSNTIAQKLLVAHSGYF